MRPGGLRRWVLIVIASLAACTSRPPAVHTADSAGVTKSVAVYVARRKWHIDVGFAAADLDPSLLPVKAEFATAKYVFFGFGDRRYLLTKNKNAPLLLRALLPGPALVLVTAIDGAPTIAFGQSQVLRVELSSAQSHAMQAFIRASLPGSELNPLAPGPYAASAFYAAPQRYSALHTCNTWAAEALRAADQPIRATGVIFAWQLWRQLLHLEPNRLQAPVVP